MERKPDYPHTPISDQHSLYIDPDVTGPMTFDQILEMAQTHFQRPDLKSDDIIISPRSINIACSCCPEYEAFLEIYLANKEPQNDLQKV